MANRRLSVGVSGASGAPVTIELLQQLQTEKDLEVHLICSKWGLATLEHEAGVTRQDLEGLCTRAYDEEDRGAAPASGSFSAVGMAVVPCSMKTLAGIVSGYSDSLLLRAADVTLKERRPLVLMPRECPLSTLHLRYLTAVSELGAVVVPPVPAWYDHPRTMEVVNRQIAARIVRMLPLGRQLPWEWRGLS